ALRVRGGQLDDWYADASYELHRRFSSFLLNCPLSLFARCSLAQRYPLGCRSLVGSGDRDSADDGRGCFQPQRRRCKGGDGCPCRPSHLWRSAGRHNRTRRSDRHSRFEGEDDMTTLTHGEQLPDVVMPTCDNHQLLRGQKAIVTGANSGIGKGIAIALGEAGADVVVNYVRDEGTADEVVQNIRRCGSKAYAHYA